MRIGVCDSHLPTSVILSVGSLLSGPESVVCIYAFWYKVARASRWFHRRLTDARVDMRSAKPTRRSVRAAMQQKTPRRLVVLVLPLLLLAVCLPESRGSAERTFELRGTIVRADGISFHDVRAIVQIRGPNLPTGLSTIADSRGRFRFKKVQPGTYLLTAFIPRVARIKRTIEIGPSSADEKRRIDLDLTLESRPRSPGRFQVPATQLSVPEKARAEYAKGLRRLARSDLAGASDSFMQALDLAPQFAAARYQLGLVACQQERYADAVNHFREALSHNPESFQTLLSLGAALLALRNGTEAVAVNERAARARPDDPEAQAQLGISYFTVNRLEDAERHLKATIALDPANFYYPQLLLAEIYRRRRDYSSATWQLEEFLRLHPDSQKAREVPEMLKEIRALMTKETSADSAR